MKRNDEDKLIDLAFGDLPAEEAERLSLSAEGDPALAATLRTYREMRDGLSALKQVPDMQMSCDRLRDAILAGGLREPKTSGWSWFAVPAMLAAAAFVITLTVRKPALPFPAGTVASMTPRESAMPGTIELKRLPIVDTSPAGATTSLGTKLSFQRNLMDTPSIVQKPRGGTAATVASASRPTVRTAGLIDPINHPRLSAPTEGFASGQMPGATEKKDTIPSADMKTAGLIVIEPEKSGETGAQKATEVESASNYVIGG